MNVCRRPLLCSVGFENLIDFGSLLRHINRDRYFSHLKNSLACHCHLYRYFGEKWQNGRRWIRQQQDIDGGSDVCPKFNPDARKCAQGLALVVLITIGCLSPAAAGQYAVLLGEEQVASGSDVAFTLVFLQLSPGEQAVFPAELACDLSTADGRYRSILAKRQTPGETNGKSTLKTYFKQLYSLRLPDNMDGQLVMKITGIEVPPLVIYAIEPEGQKSSLAEHSYPTLDSLFTLYQPYAKNASAYEPMYFLAGTELSKSKFQISFKYRFIHPQTVLAKRFPWVSGLHFGYTQTSFWDLESDSAPFSDTSYKPELFWLSDNYLSSSSGLFKGVFFQGGIQHESNGRGGDTSRSTNYLYGQPIFVFYSDRSKLGLQVAPKLWAYVHNDDITNPDLMDYRGYFELEAKAGFADSMVVGSTLRWARQGWINSTGLLLPAAQIF